MAGLYIHVPFCKTRCVYCDFYSTTGQTAMEAAYVDALCHEIETRKSYLQGQPLNTIYLGGGTPSQLSPTHLRRIFDTIDATFGMTDVLEITLEANPDDLNESYLHNLALLPFNRISLGIQTFDETMLHFLRRRHTAQQAVEAVKRCRDAGFANISIDLIYGLPGETMMQWQNDIDQALSLAVQHISAYSLTYEAGTPLYKLLKAHRVEELGEENCRRQYKFLVESMKAAGYRHYEISNFALPGFQSKHNSSYWHGIPYLGCGPSAHSYNGCSREWNVASLQTYIKGVEGGKRVFEEEMLDEDTRYNEYVMTALRTDEGVSADKLEAFFGKERLDYCLSLAEPYLAGGELVREGGCIRFSEKGVFVSDYILSDLMIV